MGNHFKRQNLSWFLNKTDLGVKASELWIGFEGQLVYNTFMRLAQMVNRELWLAGSC